MAGETSIIRAVSLIKANAFSSFGGASRAFCFIGTELSVMRSGRVRDPPRILLTHRRNSAHEFRHKPRIALNEVELPDPPVLSNDE